MAIITHKHVLLALLVLFISSTITNGTSVKYDSRSLIINGDRNLFFSGSIHYPRSPPELWPDLITKAKEGGLNVIQTYVFWNVHEPVQGQYNFEGRNDLVKFIKLIGEQGLYVTLRVGPYIEAEWNAGGFPYWLREVSNVTFRTYNEPFMYHMQKYTEMVINMMKKEKLFAPEGGPIIMAQIENEYNNVQLAYKESGLKYVEWAANMALSTYDKVPWVMCKQKQAPSTIISTCNGRHCGETWDGPNGEDKPSMWTENWTAQYRVFGDPPSQRAAEDISYAVTLFFAMNGTLTNYYMYHGGTNFGRTASSFVTTRYYDEAPLDEYGLKREPKFGHLRDLHTALRLSKKALLWGARTETYLSTNQRVVKHEMSDGKACAAFLINNDTSDTTLNFNGEKYFMLPKSISVLPDCKTVVYNTMTVVAQHNSRNFHKSSKVGEIKWEYFIESIPTMGQMSIQNRNPLELYSLAKDTSDYAWYSTSIRLQESDLPRKTTILPVLQVVSLGHALAVFVNGEYVGFEHGTNIRKDFVFQRPIKLKRGYNDITLLGMTVGFPNSGAYMEKRFAGPDAVILQGLMSGTLDITFNKWGHKVGILGEDEKVYTEDGSSKRDWKSLSESGLNTSVTWYKTYFDAPEGTSPVAIKMNKMGKGMIWVNGESIGRYWTTYLNPLGQPSQSEYHIPRAFLKQKKNLLVVLEEIGGDPKAIEFVTVNRDTICSIINEYHLPDVRSWEMVDGQFRTTTDDLTAAAHLTCPDEKVIKSVDFASFGDSEGSCGELKLGDCNVPKIPEYVQQACMGKNECKIPMDKKLLLKGNSDPCPNIMKRLAVQVRCGRTGRD